MTNPIGPLRYEVVEPLRKVRFVLEPNVCQPIAFEWLFGDGEGWGNVQPIITGGHPALGLTAEDSFR